MKKGDPQKYRINVVAVNGASNVQKAADLLKEHFPAITVMQCIEHTIALGRLIGLHPIKDLCQFANMVSICICRFLFNSSSNYLFSAFTEV